MSLGDFFTLTEMKDGLVTVARVEELISLMKKEKDNSIKNIGDAARQWSVVAEVLTATEREDCLNHFIKLDGHQFLDQWLEQAEKLADGPGKNFYAELTETLLAALEKLPTENGGINASGVSLTVKHLIGHKVFKIREKAKQLFNSCSQITDANSCFDQEEKSSANLDDNLKAAGTKMPSSGNDHLNQIDTDSKSQSSQGSQYRDQLPKNDTEDDVIMHPADGGVMLDIPHGHGVVDMKESSDVKSFLEKDIMHASGGKDAEQKASWQSSNLSDSSRPDESGMDIVTKESEETGEVDSGIFMEASRRGLADSDGGATDQRSGMELDYTEDALEVARLVARQVEQEVVDYRELSPSSEKNSQDVVAVFGSMEKAGNQQKSQSRSSGSVSTACQRASNVGDEAPTKENIDQLICEDPEESIEKTERNNCYFDLNEDVSCEEVLDQFVPSREQPKMILSIPIPVIAVSKGISTLPDALFQFGGAKGWKGSAVTSAFRRASPRRNSDGEKSCVGEASSQILKCKQNVLDIDLNVAENDEDLVASLRPTKRDRVSSGPVSGESSVEVSSQKAEKLNLDLNQLVDHEEPDLLQERSLEKGLAHRCHQVERSPSPASSTSSKQLLLRDFDLNDKPSMVDGCGFEGSMQEPSKIMAQEGPSRLSGFRVDDPVVFIMGSKIKPECRNPISQPYGRIMSTADHDMTQAGQMNIAGRFMQTYSPLPQPIYGYNGFTMGPTASLPQLYGPCTSSYVMDAGIPSVVPQTMGPTQPFSRPFLVNVAGSTPAFPRFGLDLNSGVVSAEGDGQGMGLRHLSFQGYGSIMDEQLKSGMQQNGPAIGLKRKEPDCGWEMSMLGRRQEMPWNR